MSASPRVATATPRGLPGVTCWIACLAVAAAILVSPFAGLGVSARTLASSCAYVVLFIVLPGLAVLPRTRWMSGSPLEFAAWCASTGLALVPIWLTPLWMAGLVRLVWAVPVASIVALVPVRGRLAAYLDGAMAARTTLHWLGLAASLAAFVAVSACLGVMYPFAAAGVIDPHFVTQGSIVRNLMDGWPPMNQLLEGMPLSYNYGVHLAMMVLVQSGFADMVEVVARVAPVLLLEATVIAFLAFGRTVLGLARPALLLAAIAAFWIVGFGPVNFAIYGSVLPSSSTYVVSSPAAFIVYFVALRFLVTPPARAWQAAAMAAALAFSITAMRGQGGPVWIAVIAFLCVLPLPRERRLDTNALWLLLGATLGVLLALRVFFTLGSGFSGTSFLRFNTTFGWLAEQNGVFTFVQWLREHHLTDRKAGAIGFAVMALMQAKFLAPAFLRWLATLRLTDSRPVMLLAATALAGIMATMLTNSPGGSHFSFLHYATLSMTLLGGVGLSGLFAAQAPRKRPWVRPVVLGMTALLFVASAWDLAGQLKLMGRYWLAGPVVLHRLPEIDPLVQRVPDRGMLLPVLRPHDHTQAIEAEWGMLYGVRFATYPQLLMEYAGWENALHPVLQRRFVVMGVMEIPMEHGTLPAKDLAALDATLSRPQPLYVIAPNEIHAEADPRIRTLASTKDYTLYIFQP